jgi:UDP-N-acetylmuramoyl-tripeptide--D-alanyl-D-alanine ligase
MIKKIYHRLISLPSVKRILHPEKYKTVAFFLQYLKNAGCDVRLNDKGKENKNKVIMELSVLDTVYESFSFSPQNACMVSTRQNAEDAVRKGAILLITHDNFEEYPCLITDNPLAVFAKIGRYYRDLHDQLKVIAVSGSIGKTTTKNMIGEIYNTTYRTYYNKTNANTRRSVGEAVQNIPSTAERMIQEIHEGNPGETQYISEMIRPDMFVITSIDKSHFMKFENEDKIVEEVCSIAKHMPKNGTVIVNIDEFKRFDLLNGQTIISISEKNKDADFLVQDIHTLRNGLSFSIIVKKNNATYQVTLDNIFAPHNAICALYAFAVATCDGILPENIVKGLGKYKTDGIRQNIVHTKDNIIVYADCYNAVEKSIKAAIDGADLIHAEGKRIAVLGDIKESGTLVTDMHANVMQYVINSKFDYLITIGEEMCKAVETIKDNGKLIIHKCQSLDEVATLLKTIMNSGDLVLFKASRTVELEKVINELWPSEIL